MKKYKVVFADLDDTLITTNTGNTFPKGIWDIKMKFDVWDKLKELHPSYFIIVTNQGGIGTFVSQEHFETKLRYVAESIKDYTGINFIDYIYCASLDKTDVNRKPNTGMLELTSTRYNFCLKDSTIQKSDMLMIGDASGKPGDFSDSDKKCAENFKIDYLDVNDFININIEE